MSLKTFIKWSGNKSKHLRHILPYVPEKFNTYFEPFLGSGALFLELEPDNWVVNDLNKDCVNVWRNVRDNPDEIIDAFKKFGKKFKKMSKRRKTDYCREVTENIDQMKYDLNRAVTYLLMKYCVYMGNIIINNKFYFKGLDLPISMNNNCTFLNNNYFDNLTDVSDYLYETEGLILNKDYKDILNRTKKGDFVFLDPPYIEDHNYDFNYNKNENLNYKFLYNLHNEVKKLDLKGVKWLMTQADTKEVKKTFKEYNIKKFEVYRRGRNSYINELIIMNY